MIDLAELTDKIAQARAGGVRPGTVLELDLAEAPEEPGPASPLSKLQQQLARTLDLRATIRALDRASRDDRVVGLVARVGLEGAPVSVCEELRDAVRRFRAAGKATRCWSEGLPSLPALAVAAAFEHVTVLGAGQVAVTGLASRTNFLGEALPAAGIEPQFLQRHEYKSMADVFTRTDFTEPHEEAVRAVQASVLDRLVASVARDRGLGADDVRRAVEDGPHDAEAAVALGLVDATGFADEVWATAAPEDAPLQYLERYVHHATRARRGRTPKRPTIAVVPVTGGISSGRSGGLKPGLPPGPGTGSDTFVSAVRAAVADDDVVAVVVRVDSPGGSAVASEVMARAVAVGREAGTPFVASMGSVAASGGYYVSAPCDRIVANATTITGSIGVVSGKLVTAGLRERLHIASRELATSDNATLLSSLQVWDDDQLARMEAEIDRVYDLFLQRVAEGRDLERDAVHEVARGRVWTGADALDRGLVDVLGGFHEALAEARALAGLEPDAPVEVTGFPKSSPLDVLRKPESSRPAAGLVGGPGAVADLASLVDALLLQPGGLPSVLRSLADLLEGPGARDAVQARLLGDWSIR